MQKSITAAAPPPQQSPPSQLHFLGVPVSCESRGIGFVVFEETGAAKEYRMLRVIFEHGSPLEAVPVVLESWHVRFHFDRPVLKLPVQNASLNGHGAAIGLGYDERVVRARLAGLKGMAA